MGYSWERLQPPPGLVIKATLTINGRKADSLRLGHSGRWGSNGELSLAGRGLPALPATSGLRELDAALTVPEGHLSSPKDAQRLSRRVHPGKWQSPDAGRACRRGDAGIRYAPVEQG